MKSKKIKVNRLEMRDCLMELKTEMEQCSGYLDKLMAEENAEVKKVYADLMYNIFNSYVNEIPKVIDEL